jgi:hypothetical protein
MAAYYNGYIGASIAAYYNGYRGGPNYLPVLMARERGLNFGLL